MCIRDRYQRRVHGIIDIMESLDNWGKTQGYIGYLHVKTGLRHAYLVIILGVISFLLLLNAILKGFVLVAVGIIVPAYQTFKAIESPGTEDDTKLLYYWCVLGCLMILDRFLGFLLDYMWLPGVIRCAILLSLILMDYKLSKIVYDNTIGPLLRRYHIYIDRATASVNTAAKEGINDAKQMGTDIAAQKAAEAVTGSLKSDQNCANHKSCLLYTSPSPRDLSTSRMPSSA
eukprot:TRINITY_DN4527_c0_g1_i4.p1 TRINITY_DN4527_c0_g1~~TRINITY_DN4527_c0_g1_i4.p1  ORF type:complete len:230 (-),score=30.80 TRINITY_DN4527_c0_g1_i4:133-822(-)